MMNTGVPSGGIISEKEHNLQDAERLTPPRLVLFGSTENSTPISNAYTAGLTRYFARNGLATPPDLARQMNDCTLKGRPDITQELAPIRELMAQIVAYMKEKLGRDTDYAGHPIDEGSVWAAIEKLSDDQTNGGLEVLPEAVKFVRQLHTAGIAVGFETLEPKKDTWIDQDAREAKLVKNFAEMDGPVGRDVWRLSGEVNDMQASRRAGATGVLISDTPPSQLDAVDSRNTVVVQNFSQLSALLAQVQTRMPTPSVGITDFQGTKPPDHSVV